MAKEFKPCSSEGCNGDASRGGRGFCSSHWHRWKRYGDPLKGRPPLNLDHGPLCSIEDCGRPYYGRGYCSRHWERWHIHGDPLAGGKSPGASREYLETVVLPYNGSECLTWPFRTDEHGYGEINIGKKRHKVSRYVCTKIHGEPPTPKYQAAHSCGNGHLACVTRNHLSWKTRAENEADKVIHGTHNRGERHPLSKLTENDVREIRSLSGTITYKEIASRFAISLGCVRNVIARRAWAHTA